MTVLVFGNPYLEQDNFALEVADRLLPEVECVKCTSPDDLLDYVGQQIIILDVVKNIRDPILITNMDQIKSASLMSLHDFDVGYFIALLKNLDMLPTITIIGVPPQGNVETITLQVKTWIKKELCLLS